MVSRNTVLALLCLFIGAETAGCRVTGLSAQMNSDTLVPSFGLNMVPPQTEPPLPQDEGPTVDKDQ